MLIVSAIDALFKNSVMIALKSFVVGMATEDVANVDVAKVLVTVVVVVVLVVLLAFSSIIAMSAQPKKFSCITPQPTQLLLVSVSMPQLFPATYLHCLF